MKRKYVIQILFMISCFITTTISAKDIMSKKITITGISDSATSVNIYVHFYYYMHLTKSSTFYDVPIVNKKFIFSKPCYDHPFYVTIVFKKDSASIATLVNYLMEGNDSINIRQTGRIIDFEGTNASSFACQRKLELIKPIPKFVDLKKVKDAYGHLTMLQHLYDSIKTKKMEELALYKDSISERAYSVLKTDIESEKLYHDYVDVDSYPYFFGQDSMAQQRIVDYFKDSLLTKNLYTGANQFGALYSRVYSDYMLTKIHVDAGMAEFGIGKGYTFRRLTAIEDLNHIQKKSAQFLLEKMLATFFIRRLSIDDSLFVAVRNIRNGVKNEAMRTVLLDLERKSKGAPVHDFVLPDSSGKMYSLKDFLGKTVIIDFWYTGCTWCAQLKNATRSFIESKNSDFVFITICVDDDREMWKRSVQAGKYTTRKELNLYADQKGSSRSFMDYYGVTFFPFVIIVSPSGKISAINPHNARYDTQSIKKFEDVVDTAADVR